MSTKPSKEIQTFSNPKPGRPYHIEFDCPEFTCLCPLTGQPDFAHIKIEYIPKDLCVELKSLKLYLWSFRDEGAFHEKVTNDIVDHIAGKIDPIYLKVTGDFYVRGGITTIVTAEHGKLP